MKEITESVSSSSSLTLALVLEQSQSVLLSQQLNVSLIFLICDFTELLDVTVLQGKKNVNETCSSSEINHSLFIFTVTSERRKSLQLLNAIVWYYIYLFQLNLSPHAPTLVFTLTTEKNNF